MYEKLITGALTATGALAYNLWGFWKAFQATKTTRVKERFDWQKTVTTIVPSIVAGFLAGYALDPSGVVEFLSLVMSGFGVAAAQSKLGIKNFFA